MSERWRATVAIVVTGWLMVACVSAPAVTADGRPTSEAASTPIPTFTPPPMPTRSATPKPTPLSTIEPSATPAAENTCSHSQAVYTVTYPADWYVNTPTQSYPECSAFAPQPFGDPETDPTVAITMLAEPDLGWNNPLGPLPGEFEGYRILVDAASTIGGRPGWVREFELTSDHDRAGELMVSYSVALENSWFLTATSIAPPARYEDYKAVLVAMLAGLRVPDDGP